jgi:Flp pilus assembly protein TadG
MSGGIIRRAAGRFARQSSGATAVEFALLAGPMLMMLLGSIEAGRAMWIRQALSETAIAGARCMGVRQTECSANGVYSASKTLSHVVATGASYQISIATADVTLNANTSCAGVVGNSKVTLATPFETPIPGFLTEMAGVHVLRASACFPNQP